MNPGEQLLHGLWAILPEIILLLLGILVIAIDLIKPASCGRIVRLPHDRRR